MDMNHRPCRGHGDSVVFTHSKVVLKSIKPSQLKPSIKVDGAETAEPLYATSGWLGDVILVSVVWSIISLSARPEGPPWQWMYKVFLCIKAQ